MTRRPRRSTLAGFVVAATMLVAGAGVGAFQVSAPATVSMRAERVETPSRALLVSDSAWLGIKTYGAKDAMQGFDHWLDLASCRRRVAPSCRNYDGHVPITMLDEVAWRGGTFDTLIVATGYNDSDRTFRSDVDRIVAMTRDYGYRRIVWVTLRSNVSYTSPGNAGFGEVFERNNRTLRELVDSGAYPEIVIADWATYARDRHEWFARDGIHLRGDGPWAAADYVSRKIAHLDRRPCPADGTPATVCPDPDATGAVIALGALYPIGAPNPTAGFHMEWEGRGAWPGPPWWTS